MNFDEHTDQIKSIRSNIKSLEDQVKDLKSDLKGLEYQLIHQMKEVGLDRIRTEAGSFSVGTQVVYNIKNYDDLISYVLKTGDVSVFQRRISQKVVGEKLQIGEIVPGIEPVELDKLNFRSN